MEWNQVILGDAVDVLPDIPDSVVDLVVTSPPYDNLRTYEGKHNFTWDMFVAIATELYRLLKVGGVVVWIVGDQTIDGSETGSSFRQVLRFIDIGFRLFDTMIWQKPGIMFPDHVRYYQMFEYMFVLSKEKPKTINRIRDVQNQLAGMSIHGTETQRDGTRKPKSGVKNKRVIGEMGIRGNVWRVRRACVSRGSFVHDHPAIMPSQLAMDHIRSWSNKRDLILDPMAGSGTTLEAAQLLGRQYLGIECVPRYYEIIKRRLAGNFHFV